MEHRFERVVALLGREALARLAESAVLVAGLGGVGGPCAEALVRTGVGRVDVLDAERVETSNLNRQPLALVSSLGRRKVELFAERARDINPDIQVTTYPFRLNRETKALITLDQYDVVADAIDSLIPKLNLIIACLEQDIPVVSSTGAGWKTDPGAIAVASIWETRHDRLAHRMRKKLRQWGHGHRDFPVVYSTELPPLQEPGGDPAPRGIGAIMTVTASFGLRLAATVLDTLLQAPSRLDPGAVIGHNDGRDNVA